VTIVELPRHGNLTQTVGAKLQQITSVPSTLSDNFTAGLIYSPKPGFNGGDSLRYSVSDGRTLSESTEFRFLFLKVDTVPVVQPMRLEVMEDKQDGTPPFALAGLDPDSPVTTVLITRLPKKGRLYTRDGTQIHEPFSPTRILQPLPQMFAINVINVSSFWAGTPAATDGEALCPPGAYNSSESCGYPKWHPMQIVGPPRLQGDMSVEQSGDSFYAFAPGSEDGDGKRMKGGDAYLHFDWDASAAFLQYGYTEFIEVRIATKSYIQRVEVGEPRGTQMVGSLLFG
jgi:hypothetical protein